VAADYLTDRKNWLVSSTQHRPGELGFLSKGMGNTLFLLSEEGTAQCLTQPLQGFVQICSAPSVIEGPNSQVMRIKFLPMVAV